MAGTCKAVKISSPALPPSVGSLLHATGACTPCPEFWQPEGCGEGEAAKAPDASSLFRPPPGLEGIQAEAVCADVNEGLQRPVGSSLHGTGMCKPCAWYWKPQGCSNGAECKHCHMCPKDEVKARSRRKLKKAGNDAELSTTGALGSALHGTGLCKPCAWFWKPGGCKNGDECKHCHLCPEGEIKARKMANKAAAKIAVCQRRKINLAKVRPGPRRSYATFSSEVSSLASGTTLEPDDDSESLSHDEEQPRPLKLQEELDFGQTPAHTAMGFSAMQLQRCLQMQWTIHHQQMELEMMRQQIVPLLDALQTKKQARSV